MTKEQEEAIEMLEDIKNNTWTTKYIMSSDSKKAETVLNMLKENSAEIEQKNTELAEKSAEIEKKDKIIDLMTEYINYLSDELVQATGKNELDFCDGNKCCKDSDYSCEECIKQYFERKVEE